MDNVNVCLLLLLLLLALLLFFCFCSFFPYHSEHNGSINENGKQEGRRTTLKMIIATNE